MIWSMPQEGYVINLLLEAASQPSFLLIFYKKNLTTMTKKNEKKKVTWKASQKAIKPEKHPGGRPSKFSEEVVRKLEDAFRCAGNDTEACAYAGISRETFYDWLNPDKKFSDNFTQEMQEEFIARINAAKVYPKIGCKKTLVQSGIRGDRRAAIEYLKRTDPDFKDKQETTLKGDAENPVQIFIPDNWRWPKK